MNFDEFFDRLEKWEEETEENSRRKAITAVLRSRPSEYKDAIAKSSLDRIMWYFENAKFGVISACKTNNSKKKNFDVQLRLLLRLRKQKLHCIPHLGFWERIASRSLFIPQISRRCIDILVEELKLKTFIWGKNREWKCYRICNRNIVFNDTKLKIVDIDMDFLIYSRIIALKNQYITTINNITKISNISNHQTMKVLSHTQSKINDLQRIEKELFQEIRPSLNSFSVPN